MRNARMMAVLAVSTFLSACGSSTEASDKNFRAALQQHFDQRGDLCLNLPRWPIDVPEAEQRLAAVLATSIGAQMAALAAAGLVVGEEVEVTPASMFGSPLDSKVKVRRYRPSAAAKAFTRSAEGESGSQGGDTPEGRTDLCWGKQALERIVQWEGPIKLGDYQEAEVTFTYKVKHQASWARHPQCGRRFRRFNRCWQGRRTARAAIFRHRVKAKLGMVHPRVF